MYLLDTCFLSEVKKKQPDQGVIAAFADIPGPAMHISVISLGEIESGITIMPESQKKRDLYHWCERLRQNFQQNTLPIDQNVMQTWAQLVAGLRRKGTPMPAFDSLIAATALQHNLTVITRNVRDFEPAGVAVYNPWSVD